MVWLSRWVYSWGGMLSVVVTDISTTWVEVINKVKWIVSVVSWMSSCQSLLTFNWQQLFTRLSWWLPLRLSKHQSPQQQSFSGLHSPWQTIRPHYSMLPWVQTIYCITAFVTTDRMSEKEYIIKSKSKVCRCYCCLYLKYNYTYKLKYLLHQQVKRPEYQLVVYIH